MTIERMPLIRRRFGQPEIQRWLLTEGSREEIIEWLVWNDGNDVYTDEDSAAEGYEPLTLESARKTMMAIITRDFDEEPVDESSRGSRDMTREIASKYQIPDELMAFVNDGFLEILSEREAEKTIEFHVPSKRTVDPDGRITTYSVTWIHPDFNDQFCHYYPKQPGDLPNFYVTEDTTDLGDEQVDGLDSVSDLVDWLERFMNARLAE